MYQGRVGSLQGRDLFGSVRFGFASQKALGSLCQPVIPRLPTRSSLLLTRFPVIADWWLR